MIFAPKHVASLLVLPAALFAQRPQQQIQRADSTGQIPPAHYWRNVTLGFMSSILFHEAGHVVTAYAIGGHPTLGFDKGRPTIYSGIDASTAPHKQFLFSSAGLNVQAILDESVMDVPHPSKGSAFERGILAGGIATAYFYATLGRNASVSDITFMAKTSSLSKTQASLIYAGLATIQVFRISKDHHYANFFMRPREEPGKNTGGVDVGVAILSE